MQVRVDISVVYDLLSVPHTHISYRLFVSSQSGLATGMMMVSQSTLSLPRRVEQVLSSIPLLKAVGMPQR